MRIALSKFTRENFGKLKYMHPAVQRLFTEFYCRIAMEGIYIRVPDEGGMRTAEDQRQLYNRTPRVTWVLCPHSWHCHGLALDIIPLWRIGVLQYRALWSAPYYERIARIALELGIEWGFALWGVDKPHFHYSGGLTIQELIDDVPVHEPEFEPIEKPKVLMRALDRLDVPLP